MALRPSIHNVRQKASFFADQPGQSARLPKLGGYLSIDIAVMIWYLEVSAFSCRSNRVFVDELF
jgi:hypothetical protein